LNLKKRESMGWQEIYAIWEASIKAHDVNIEESFCLIRVSNPKMAQYQSKPFLYWDSVRPVREIAMIWQEHMDLHPTSYAAPIGFQNSSALATTIAHLWKNRTDKEQLAAILISASLASRMNNSRCHYPDEDWPYFPNVANLRDEVLYKWLGEDRYGQLWHHSSTTMLPDLKREWGSNCKTLSELIAFLADEHIEVLRQYRMVGVEIVVERDPLISAALKKKREERDKENAEFNASIQKRREEAANLEAQKLRDHPKFAEWYALTAEELEKLVWSKPATMLAKEFGLSDVMIGKRCKKLGVVKPKPGFWAKVDAGKVPHPQGKKVAGQ